MVNVSSTMSSLIILTIPVNLPTPVTAPVNIAHPVTMTSIMNLPTLMTLAGPLNIAMRPVKSMPFLPQALPHNEFSDNTHHTCQFTNSSYCASEHCTSSHYDLNNESPNTNDISWPFKYSHETCEKHAFPSPGIASLSPQ
ncbi:hypothetical protein E2320_016068 [Naja naja]|nr:hypothetical protein E2320_016068 [Naja naja]